MKINKFFNNSVTLVITGLFAGMFLNISTAMAAFGTSPPWVKNDHLLPGTAFEQVITLSRNDTEEEMKAAVRISGDKELVEWITIQNEENLIMKKGQTALPLKVVINIPKLAAIRNYRGGIFISLTPVTAGNSMEGGEVAIGLGAHISVDLSVIGNKITDYEIKSVSAEPRKQDDPFFINMEIMNKGNTEINYLKGQIDIYNGINTKLLKSLTFTPFDEPVSPDEIKKVRMTFRNFKPDAGEHWIAVKAFKDGKIIYKNRFLQKMKNEVIPVIASGDIVTKKSSLSGIDEDTDISPPAVQAPPADINPAATTAAKTNNAYRIFGLAGLGLSLAAIIGIIAILIF